MDFVKVMFGLMALEALDRKIERVIAERKANEQ